MKFYEATRLCQAAFNLTGNAKFIEMEELLEQSKTLLDNAAKFTASFPSEGEPYVKGVLEKKINERMEHTKAYIAFVNKFRSDQR